MHYKIQNETHHIYLPSPNTSALGRSRSRYSTRKAQSILSKNLRQVHGQDLALYVNMSRVETDTRSLCKVRDIVL